MRDGTAAALGVLVQALHTDLAGREITDPTLRAECAVIRRCWSAAVPAASPALPRLLPACAHLAETMAAGAAGAARALVAAIAPFLPALHWRYGYPTLPGAPGLAERIAFAPIIGNRAPCADATVHLGLTLMAPETTYPMHAHPAVELYLVLAGEAGWRQGVAPFAVQPPGALILHGSGVGHAMRSGPAPLLVLYVWRGDLVTAPAYLPEAAPGT